VTVTTDADNDFTFITLSDIHVHERDNSTLVTKQTNKGISEEGEPLFFEEAIEQVNLIKPDFVLMLGDYIRGQRRPGDLASEYAGFYQALQGLEVPAFILPGNHDQYVNEIDGARYFEENLGPLYFSFDIGDCHFTCLDTYQWPQDDRIVMNKLLYMDPNKWQGQVLGAGDERDEASYDGELAWIRDDLEAHRPASLRVMAVHHDPYTEDGKGYSFNQIIRWGIRVPGGGGKGKAALRELASSHDVAMLFGGHLHVDRVGESPWEDGGGETVYSCQTCVYFDEGGHSDHYPGYRLVEVDDGIIASFAYLDSVSSYPFYDGSVPEGETDLDLLELPALRQEVSEETTDERWRLSFEVENYLGTDMELSGLTAPALQRPEGDYKVDGGEIYRVVPMSDKPGWVLLYLKTKVRAGIPGEDSDHSGQPSVTNITIQ
jgi:hypothetical protein